MYFSPPLALRQLCVSVGTALVFVVPGQDVKIYAGKQNKRDLSTGNKVLRGKT